MQKRIKILYIEDDEITKVLFLNKFKNYDVMEASDGIDGLKKYNEFMPDIVITDMIIPKMSGEKMIKEIYKVKADQNIIVISGVVEDLDFGPNCKFLKKPVAFSDVLNLIESY